MSAAQYYLLHDHPAAEAYKILRTRVNELNRKRGIEQTTRSVAVFKWGEEGMVAGACGVVYPGWLSLDLLWVEDAYRKQGIGAEVLKRIEDEATRLGAHSAYVWSQDFEAPDFYRRHGYQDFVQLEEFLPGHQLIGMQKRLIGSG